MNVTECLLKITELTQQNLDILQAINESFFAKNTYVQANVSGTRFNIPSFISLENKVNHLQDAFDNLVHAAQSGEAWLNYDGNTRDIVLQQYHQAPNPLNLRAVSSFSSETIDMFKDMMSPTPYVNFSCGELPDNITQINVKKVVIYSEDIISELIPLIDPDNKNTNSSNDIISGGISYSDLMDILDREEYKDEYDIYDTIYDLNPRKTLGYGVYTIVDVVGDKIRDVKEDEDGNDLSEVITVTLQKETNDLGEYLPLSWVGTDGYTTQDLYDGCYLSSYDGTAIFKIIGGLSEDSDQNHDVTEPTAKVVLQVMHGVYVSLQPGNGDYGKLKFHSVSDDEMIEEDKNLHIPLEEDRYICLFTAPLNSRVLVQSVWGTGLYIDTYKLTMDDTDISFEEYYDENVSNIGDVLTELTTIMSPSITKFSKDEFEWLTSAQPNLEQTEDHTTLNVVQINKHLDESETVKTIRSLYAQKQQLNTELTEVQENIANINSELSQISFDDLSGTRSMYEAQLTDLKARQNELSSSISKVVDLIEQSANNSVIPIENAKFRIRGYVDVQEFIDIVNKKNSEDDSDTTEAKQIISLEDVIGVQIRYRYKNPDTPQANVSVVNDFLFTEWTEQDPNVRKRRMSYENGEYKLQWQDIVQTETGTELNSTDNVPKFNQVDIPITQGETVDVSARILYIFGYPFVEVTSGWSEIENIEFPDELITDVQVLTIIEENNNDIETLRFENILENKGVNAHVDDKIVDQDLTYFHKPENISSGFYTEERRIIPLRDKLTEMNNSITEIEDLIKGTTSEALEVSVILDNQIYTLEPDIDNQIQLTPYSNIQVGQVASGTAFRNKSYGPVQMTGSIKITNTTEHTVYLYSVFPGSRTTNIPDIRASRRRFDLTDYYNFGANKLIIQSSDAENQ